MTNNDEVVFDSASGISIEEQKEILSKINGIAEKNRSRLSRGFEQEVKPGDKIQITAEKNGALFPLAVNIAAFLLLSVCGFLMIYFFGKADVSIREGGAVYNLTERALIEEIRRDTAEKIAFKEKEITQILSKLEDADAKLNMLYSGNQELTPEQLAVKEELVAIQNSCRTGLTSLREERSQILEESRSKELKLRAQLEAKNRESAAVQRKTYDEPDSAMSELDLLSSEQEKNAAVDAYLAGGIASISNLIQGGQYDQAAQLIKRLSLFLNNSAITSVRSFQARKEFYNHAFNSMEVIIDDSLKYHSTGEWNAQLKISEMEGTIAEMEKTIDGFNSSGSGQTARITELEASVSSLRAANSSLEKNAVEKDRTIKTLESEKAGLNQTIASRDNDVKELKASNAAYEQDNTNLRNQLTIIRQTFD